MKAFMMKTDGKWVLNDSRSPTYNFTHESDKVVAEYALMGGGNKNKVVAVLDGAGRFLYGWQRINKWESPIVVKVVKCGECGAWKRFKESSNV